MKTIIMMTLLLLASRGTAKAGEDWFCKTQASKTSAYIVEACGVGEATTESEARLKAFNAAATEFHNVCNESAVCSKREHEAETKRTTCEITKEGYKCFRMVRFTLGAEKDNLEQYKPNVIMPKAMKTLHKGLKRWQVIALLGIPYGTTDTMFSYQNSEFCLYSNSLCFVHFDDKGVVSNWNMVKPELTADMEEDGQ